MFDIERPYEVFEHLLRSVPVASRIKVDLRNRHLGRTRHYHGLLHLATMWQIHRHLSPFNNAEYLLGSDCRIASAIAFHDAVYDATSKANETRSALMWEESHEGNESDRDWVFNAIMATQNHMAERPLETAQDRLREWFVGLDLASLAAPWHDFLLNNRLIRLEYIHVSDEDWKTENGFFLRSLLDSPIIYRDSFLAHRPRGPRPAGRRSR